MPLFDTFQCHSKPPFLLAYLAAIPSTPGGRSGAFVGRASQTRPLILVSATAFHHPSHGPATEGVQTRTVQRPLNVRILVSFRPGYLRDQMRHPLQPNSGQPSSLLHIPSGFTVFALEFAFERLKKGSLLVSTQYLHTVIMPASRKRVYASGDPHA